MWPCFLSQTLGTGLTPPSDPQAGPPLSPVNPPGQGGTPATSPWALSALAAQDVLTASTTTGRLPVALAISSPNSSGHRTRLEPARGQGPVPRTCKPGSCQDFRRRGPLGLTPLSHFLIWTPGQVRTLLGSASGSWSICPGKGGGHSREQVASGGLEPRKPVQTPRMCP